MAVTLTLASDTGVSASDGVTREAVLTGTGDPNTTVTILEGLVIVGSATTDASGAWTFDASGLSQGDHVLTASQTDGLGNAVNSAPLTLTLDTAGPGLTMTSSGGLRSNDTVIVYTVSFGEPVTGVDASSFSIEAGAPAGTVIRDVASVDGSNGAQYLVTIDVGAGEGSLALRFNSDGVTDIAGNALSGAPDLLFANSSSSSIGLSSSNGSGVFSPLSLFESTGSFPIDFAVGDLDGDGDQDVIAANLVSNDVSVFLQLANGAFTPGTEYLIGGGNAGRLGIGDINGDGHLDVVTANQDNNTIGLLLGQGDGTLVLAGTVPSGASDVGDISLGDIDGDGDLDIAVSNFIAVSVTVLENEGNASFLAQTPLSTNGFGTSGVELADLDGDGNLDIAASNRFSSNVSIFYGAGDGTFLDPQLYSSGGAQPEHLDVGDVNNDGYLDIATANFSGGTIGVILGGPGRQFSNAQSLVGFSSVYVSIEDITGDGTADIVSANLFSGSSVHLGAGDGNFTLLNQPVTGGDGTRAVIVGDFTGAGPAERTTLATTIDRTAPVVASIVANGPLTTNAAQVSYTVTFSESVTGVAVDQFKLVSTGVSGASIVSVDAVPGSNGTMYSVTVASGAGDGSVELSIVGSKILDLAGNQIDGMLQAATTVDVGVNPIGVATGDLDNDGDDDIVTTSPFTGQVSIILNNGDGSFAAPSLVAAGSNPRGVTIGDIDGDGDQDIVVANYISVGGASTITILENVGTGIGYTSSTVSTLQRAQTVEIADIDGNNRPDLVVTHTAASIGVSVLLQSETGSFESTQLLESVGDPVGLAVGDVDGDNINDVVFTNFPGDIQVYKGSGAGTFTQTSTIADSSNSSRVILADLNNDGADDAVFLQGTIHVALSNGDGTFAASTEYNLGPASNQLNAADMDDDGDLDLVVGNLGSSTIVTLINQGDGTFLTGTTVPVAQLAGDQYSALADINGDGRPDVVAPNATGTVTISYNEPSAISGGAFTIDRTAPEIALDVPTVDEDTSVGTLVGTLAPIGADAGATVSYQLIEDAGGRFILGGVNNDEVLVAAALDFEAVPSHQIVVRVTDTLGNATDRTLTIDVIDVNEAPQALALSELTIAENAAEGAIVATVSALDVDAGDSLTFTLDDDAGGIFVLVDNELRLSLGAALDFETASSYSVTLTATDTGGLSTTSSFDIAVTDVNEAPDTLTVTGNEVEENAAAGTFVASIEATDPDAGDTLSYALQDDAGGRFAIDGSNIVVADGTLIDYEAAASQHIAVVATDSAGLTRSLTVTVSVVDINEAPNTLTLSGGSVLENSAEGTVVATLAATDPDTGDVLSFALADDAGGLFEVVDNEIRVAAGALIDFETATSHQITVDVSDAGGLSRSETFTITVLNESPIIIGTNAANTLTGGTEDDQIFGRGGNDILLGLEEADQLFGEAGNDTLDGGEGADILRGGIGNDTYIVEDDLDTIIENANEGSDTVRAFVNAFSLAAIDNVESLIFSGTGDFLGIGNALANSISGGAGNDTLDGGSGNDTLAGGLGDDVYIVDSAGDVITEAANAGIDTVRTGLAIYSLAASANAENLIYTGSVSFSGTGNARNNVLEGGLAADFLNGGSGSDTLVGKIGNDTYVVDNAGDVVIEEIDSGIDTVNASLNHILGANIENLVLTGTGGFSGTGNGLANVITGNGGNNVLDGGAGDDQLIGGLGNDTYVVDAIGDSITEAAGQGTDLVRTSLSALSLQNFSNVENLTFTGVGAFSGTGNALANIITGGASADTIDGGAGIDRLIGGLGDDTYLVDSTQDIVVEAASGGTDTILSTANSYTLGTNVENLTYAGIGAFTANGNGLANVIVGGAGSDTLSGAAGNDTLFGGLGNDFMNGGAGNDTFVFAGGFGNDSISNFDANPGGGGQDLLDLTALNVSAVNFASRVAITDVGADTLVTVDGTDTIRLLGIGNASNVTIQDFFFIL